MGKGRSDGGNRGVAPGAYLADVRVFNDVLTIFTYVPEGMEWCIAHRDDEWEGAPDGVRGIQVMSMSLGTVYGSDGKDSLSRLADTATDNGIVVVVAAGNDGPDNNGIGAPGAADSVITVGATGDAGTVDTGDDFMAGFSSRGPRWDDGDSDHDDEKKPEVVAPGVDIDSTFKTGTGPLTRAIYQEMSGTSMACPHVAGVVALMLEANPRLHPDRVKDILIDTVRPVQPSWMPGGDTWHLDSGWGVVDARDAVLEAYNKPPNIIIHSPQPGQVVMAEGVTVDISLLDVEGDPANGTVTLFDREGVQMGGSWDISTGRSSRTIDLEEGEFSITVTATDGYDISSPVSFGFSHILHELPPPPHMYLEKDLILIGEDPYLSWYFPGNLSENITLGDINGIDVGFEVVGPDGVIVDTRLVATVGCSHEDGSDPNSTSPSVGVDPPFSICSAAFTLDLAAMATDDMTVEEYLIGTSGLMLRMTASGEMRPTWDEHVADLGYDERPVSFWNGSPYLEWWSPDDTSVMWDLNISVVTWSGSSVTLEVRIRNETGDTVWLGIPDVLGEPIAMSEMLLEVDPTAYDLERELERRTLGLDLRGLGLDRGNITIEVGMLEDAASDLSYPGSISRGVFRLHEACFDIIDIRCGPEDGYPDPDDPDGGGIDDNGDGGGIVVDDDEGGGTPGYGIPMVIFSLALVVAWRRRHP